MLDRPQGRPQSAEPLLLGQSVSMNAVRTAIATAARSDAKVLIVGETGVGKDIVAQLIHARSARARRPYIAVNCSGIPETLLESELFGHTRGSFTGAIRDKAGLIRQADGGTLFLDELGEMGLRMQAVLLRFAETGEIQPIGTDRPVGRTNVRLISATNRDLRAQIAAGAFREDLYYRLNVLEIVVPPLRERRDDIPLLLEHYCDRAAAAHGYRRPTLSPAAARVLVEYAWPGNIRELRSVTERLAMREKSVALTPDDLPVEIRGTGGSPAVDRTVTGRDDGYAVGAPLAEHVQKLWDRMAAGENFWTAVHQPFKAHEVTRSDLAALVDWGLRQTNGSYRELVTLFHLAPEEYKRFHNFLYEQRCNLSVGRYRVARSTLRSPDRLIDRA